MAETIPTDLMIAAHVRIAAQSGVSMFITHKGDANSGTIFLKINRLDGTAHVLNQIHMDGESVWVYALGEAAVDEKEADKYLSSQIDFDPDLWVIEIEDRQGRHWFDGPIVKSI